MATRHFEFEVESVTAKGSFLVESGQTCFFGGLKRRGIGTETMPAPLLGRLPWVGHRFVKTREVERDLEVLFMATVSIAE